MRYIQTSAVLAGAIAAGLLLFFWADVPKGDVTDVDHVNSERMLESADTSTLVGDDSNSQPQAYPGSSAPPTQMIYGSTATATKQSARNVASAPYSATERAMLSDGMINEAAIDALKSKQFDRLLTNFDSEQMGMTAELTASYRAELERLLGSVAEPKQIDRLVCGTDLCIASIRSPSGDWYPAWLESVQGRSGLPMHALTGNAIDRGSSGVEYRLLFSISNGVEGFTGSAPRS
ncbi:MAG: hypothetical protein ACREPE_12120 [Lysobacter sp.]